MPAFFRRRLAAKLTVGYLFAVLAVTASVGILLVRQTESLTLDQMADAVAAQGRLMVKALPPGALDGHSSSQLSAFVREWRVQPESRITLISADGTVLADSEVSPEQLPLVENHKSRPEVQEAFQGRVGRSVRKSATVGHDFFYVAVPVSDGPRVAGVLRVALPLTRVRNTMGLVGRTLATGLAAVALLIIALSAFIALRVSRPLSEITQSSKRLARGDFAARAPVRTHDEIAELGRAFNTMADQLQGKVRDLQASRNQIEGILQSMTEGVLVFEPGGGLLLMNNSARTILGASAGITLAEVTRYPDIGRLVREVLDTGRPQTKDLELYSPLNQILQVRAVPCEVPRSGRCALLVLHDITEVRRLERMRSEFVANVSHELKTPLTTIRGAVETLLEGALERPADAKEFVKAVKEEAARLNHLVEDLLTLASVESRQGSPKRGEVRVREFLEEQVARYHGAARDAKVSISLDAGALRGAVRADPEQLAQAVGNLLENAVKYNRPGGEVAVRAAESAGQLRIEVADTGIGIPPEDQPRIFERFYRVDKGRSRETGGTGLGLSIVKHVAEAHGGSVSVESEPGRGSRFTLLIPLR